MARKKLFRIQESTVLENIIQYDDPDAKKIIEDFSKSTEKIILELGCGRGEYTVGLARIFSDGHCIGMDVQGERIWHGAKSALEQKLENVLFLRGHIEQLSEYFAEQSVDQIWIPFPDPFLREKKAKKRLTSPRFLTMYKKILKQNGTVHLKTDNEVLYQFSKETVQNFGAKILLKNEELELSQDPQSPFSIQTQYEKRYRAEGKNIFYLCFQF